MLILRLASNVTRYFGACQVQEPLQNSFARPAVTVLGLAGANPSPLIDLIRQVGAALSEWRVIRPVQSVAG